jgi:hypothetical protein
MTSMISSSQPPATFRGMVARVLEDPDNRSSAVGIIGVILFYLLLWVVGPHLLRVERVGAISRPHATARQFNIEIAPDVFKKPAPKPPPMKFVETNPDAPENVPDKTNNFSSRNTQLAQEKPSPENKGDKPAIEGQKEIQTSQIVTGQLQQPPVEHLEPPPPPAQTVAEKRTATPKQEQNPLPGFEKGGRQQGRLRHQHRQGCGKHEVDPPTGRGGKKPAADSGRSRDRAARD